MARRSGRADREPGAGRGVAGLGGPSAAAGGRLHHPAGDRARPGGRANTRGWFAWRGLLAYAIGLAAEWPFVSQPDYTGPLVKTLGGADISWLVGWFAAAIVYLLLVALSPGTARHDRPIAATAR